MTKEREIKGMIKRVNNKRLAASLKNNTSETSYYNLKCTKNRYELTENNGLVTTVKLGTLNPNEIIESLRNEM